MKIAKIVIAALSAGLMLACGSAPETPVPMPTPDVSAERVATARAIATREAYNSALSSQATATFKADIVVEATAARSAPSVVAEKLALTPTRVPTSTPEPTETPTATPEPTATPMPEGWITLTKEVGYVPLTDDNRAKIAEMELENDGVHHLWDGMVMSSQRVLNLKVAWRDYLIAEFIDRCMIQGSYELPVLTKHVQAEYPDAEYMGDVSDVQFRDRNLDEIKDTGWSIYRGGDIARGGHRLVESIYKIGDDQYIMAWFMTEIETCKLTEFVYQYEPFDYESAEQFDDGIYTTRFASYHEISEHRIDPLTNHEVETGKFRCRMNCD